MQNARDVLTPDALTMLQVIAEAGSFAAAARQLGSLAIRSLYREVELSPKPGLVSPGDSGSHRDMDFRTFVRSLQSLRDYFPEIARLGTTRPGFEPLRQDAPAAERAYAAYLAGQAQPQDAALLPAPQRAVLAGGADAVKAVADPLSRLVAAGVLVPLVGVAAMYLSVTDQDPEAHADRQERRQERREAEEQEAPPPVK